MDFITHFRELIRKRGYTMKDLAHEAGIPYNTMISVTRHGNPSLKFLEQIAQTLNIPVSALVSYQDEKSNLFYIEKIEKLIEELDELKKRV